MYLPIAIKIKHSRITLQLKLMIPNFKINHNIIMFYFTQYTKYWVLDQI